MNELIFKAGDKIMYSCAAGRLRATVRGVHFGPTAKYGHSIPWLKLTTMPTKTRPFPSDLTIPADADSLSMFKVELV
jgi:hypothetical protein